MGRGRGSHEPFCVTRDPGLCSSQPPGSTRPFAGFEGQWESPGAVKSCQGLCTSCPLPQLLTTHLKCSRQGHLTQGQAVGAKAVKLVCQLYYYRANHKDIQERHTMCTQTHAHRHRCETDPCHLQRPCEDPKSICTQGTLALWHLPRAWPPPTITLHKHFSLEGCPQAQGGPQAVCVVRKLTGATHGHRALLGGVASCSWLLGYKNRHLCRTLGGPQAVCPTRTSSGWEADKPRRLPGDRGQLLGPPCSSGLLLCGLSFLSHSVRQPTSSKFPNVTKLAKTPTPPQRFWFCIPSISLGERRHQKLLPGSTQKAKGGNSQMQQGGMGDVRGSARPGCHPPH